MRDLLRNLGVACSVLGVGCASATSRISPPDPLSRNDTLARILVLEDSRSLGGGAIQSFLESDDPSIRRRAALAAGRIGDPLIEKALARRLRDSVGEVRRTAAFALGLLGSSESVAVLQAALLDPDPVLRGRAAEALGRIGQPGSAPLIAQAFRAALPESQRGALVVRGDDPGRADDPWIELRLHLVALARLKDVTALVDALTAADGGPGVDWWAATWAASRVADERLAPFLTSSAASAEPAIRALAARGLGNLKDASHLATLRKLAEDPDPSVVLQALRGLAAFGDPRGSEIASFFLDSPDLVLRHESLRTIAALQPDSRYRPRVIENVGHREAWIRAAAWRALVKIEGDEVGLVLSTIGPDADGLVRREIAGALAESLGERAAPLLVSLLGDEDRRVPPAALEALARVRGTGTAPLLVEKLEKGDAALRSAAIEALALLEEKTESRFDDAFAAAFDAALRDADFEGRLGIVDAASKKLSNDRRALLRRIAATDPSRVVRQRALSALGEGFAAPEASAIRTADARRLVAVYEPSATVLAPRAVIRTRHGAIEIVLDLVEAPLASASFSRLAQSGFFNGLPFHRVIPGFVAQGGDPRGDGSGGPGFATRCEYSMRPYGRGALGMALSGKDTGGSQFFIALEPQPHLDGAYTQFGQVVSGMDVVTKLRPGDIIERIDLFDGRDGR